MAISELERVAEKHNAQIAERYRRLQNAEADQFASVNNAQENVRASVLAPEKPVYAPATQQTPQVTEFVPARAETPVFTTDKFNGVQASAAVIAPTAPVNVPEMPVAVYTPVQEATAVQEQYTFSAMAKRALVAFAATVTVMLAVIGVNTHLINNKNIRIRNLEQKRQELMERNEELEARIETAKSEESIREYAESLGMIKE